MPDLYGRDHCGPNPYVRPHAVDWQSPGRGYPGYNPYDWSATALFRDTRCYYHWQSESAAQVRPANYTR